MKLLDIDTDGGEFLMSLHHPYRNTSATEGYPPNESLCKQTLLPLGIDFKEMSQYDNMPFDDNSYSFPLFVPQREEKRLKSLRNDIQKAKIEYEPAKGVSKTYQAIDNAGKKNPLTGNYSISTKDFADLTALAKESITSRAKIGELRERVKHYREESGRYRKAFLRLQDNYDKLTEKRSPFLQGLEHFPDAVQRFIEHISSLFAEKEKEQQRRLPKARNGQDR